MTLKGFIHVPMMAYGSGYIKVSRINAFYSDGEKGSIVRMSGDTIFVSVPMEHLTKLIEEANGEEA